MGELLLQAFSFLRFPHQIALTLLYYVFSVTIFYLWNNSQIKKEIKINKLSLYSITSSSPMFFKTKESRVFKFSSQSSGASSRAILSNSPRASFFSSVCIPEGAPSGTIRGERPSAFSKETSKTIKQCERVFVKIQTLKPRGKNKRSGAMK